MSTKKEMALIILNEILSGKGTIESFCVMMIGFLMSDYFLFDPEGSRNVSTLVFIIVFALIYLSVYSAKRNDNRTKQSDTLNMKNISMSIKHIKQAYDKKLNEAKDTINGMKLENAKLNEEIALRKAVKTVEPSKIMEP